MLCYSKVVLLAVLVFVTGEAGLGQRPHRPDHRLPIVVVAVAPLYVPIALLSHTSGKVVIEVKINSLGLVTAADAISGNPVLIGGSRQVARHWRFASIANGKQIRVVRLTFVYHLLPKNTPIDELFPVFKPPYRVEVAHVMPDESPSP